MQAPPDTLTATRVILCRATAADTDELYLLAREPEVPRYMNWPAPQGPEDTRRHLEGAAERWERGVEHQYVIRMVTSAECLGSIAFRPSGHAADFGYFLAPRYWGQGLAREAATTLLSWLEAQPQILRIWATADAENLRSRALLERLGLQLEGILRMARVYPNLGGPPRDTAMYAKLTRAAAAVTPLAATPDAES